MMRTQFGVLFLLSHWVVCSDAWFWSWTGTTTLPPTVDQEGSGSPAGSGEPPSETIAQVGAEIIDEGHGIHKSWDQTTEAPRLTTVIPPTQPESERASENSTAGISSHKIIPGNATFSMGSGDSEGHSLGSTELEQTPNTKENNPSWKYPRESTEDVLTIVVVGKTSTEVSNDNQQVEFTVNNDVLQTSQLTLPSQELHTTPTPQMLITHRAGTTLISMTSPPHVPRQTLITSQKEVTSQTPHIVGATQPSVSKQELSIETSFSQTAEGSQATTIAHTEVAKSALDVESPQCLLLDTPLPFCSSVVGEKFVVPNYFNHSTVEEVHALLKEWEWLLRSSCHHSLEWFFCLLLVPKCQQQLVLPCQSFCQVLQDSCWTLLDEGRLPVECHALPDEDDDDDDHGYQCLSVCNQKGNHCFKTNPNLGFVLNQFSTSTP